jgi:CheY-like chemotaxis protein
MKVLVVDDNVAIQEILRDILNNDGHVVRIAGTIDDAIDEILEFRPDAILLDAVINDEDGLQILVEAHDQDKDVPINAVLIKGIGDEVPKDNSFIKAVVNKPFKSSDISNALDQLVARTEAERAQDKQAKKKKSAGIIASMGLRSKKNSKKERHIDTDDAAIVAEYIAGESAMYGRSYVFFEKDPDKIYDFLGIFKPTEYSVLIISSENAKAVRQRVDSDSVEVVTLSANGRGKTMDINALGTLMVFLRKYIADHSNPLIMIDNLTDIIDSNGLNHSLVFVHQLVTIKQSNKPASFVVSVDPSILTMKDRNILLGDMSEYSN